MNLIDIKNPSSKEIWEKQFLAFQVWKEGGMNVEWTSPGSSVFFHP